MKSQYFTYFSSYADYYPFGMKMPGKFGGSSYRYAYQGKFAEKDDETGLLVFEARMYDPRIARWLITDPARQHFSLYMAMNNNPIIYIDANGRVDWPYWGRVTSGSMQVAGGFGEFWAAGAITVGSGGIATGVGIVLTADGIARMMSGLQIISAADNPGFSNNYPSNVLGWAGHTVDATSTNRKLGHFGGEIQKDGEFYNDVLSLGYAGFSHLTKKSIELSPLVFDFITNATAPVINFFDQFRLGNYTPDESFHFDGVNQLPVVEVTGE